eukprot:g98.t1
MADSGHTVPPQKKAKLQMSNKVKVSRQPGKEVAFPAEHMRDFRVTEVINYSDGGRKVCLLGMLEGAETIVGLTEKASICDAETLIAAIPSFSLNLTNHSGAEYSYYVAQSAGGAKYDVEAIWPASDRQIQRKRPMEIELFEESATCYSKLVEPFACAQAASIGWIDAVCSLQKERERNLVNADTFIVNVDTKWTTHGDFSSSRSTWKEAAWTDQLYLLAIAKDPALKSLRDLRGSAGSNLCREMRDALRRAALEVYGVPATKLRIFFHYHPQFYRLHAHAVRAEHVNPGCECDRAHLLSVVAENLERYPDYYLEATLTYKLRVGEKLHTILRDASEPQLAPSFDDCDGVPEGGS